VTVNGDAAFEADETVNIKFSGAKLAADVTATGTITNDDRDTANDPQTFMLTTGVDNIAGTGSNDTINAVQTSTSGSVFGGLDVVDGAGGNDTLNVQDTATAASAAFSFNGATIKNVETLALTTSGYLKNLDLSGFTGLKTVSLLANSTDASADNTGLKLGSIDTVAVTAQAGNVSIASGGKAINITAAGAATIDVGATGAGTQNNQRHQPDLENRQRHRQGLRFGPDRCHRVGRWHRHDSKQRLLGRQRQRHHSQERHAQER